MNFKNPLYYLTNIHLLEWKYQLYKYFNNIRQIAMNNNLKVSVIIPYCKTEVFIDGTIHFLL